MSALTFDIKGMSCGGCVAGVSRALEKLDGVTDVHVSLQPGQATLQADPARVTPAQIAMAISKLGYPASARP